MERRDKKVKVKAVERGEKEEERARSSSLADY